MADMVASALAQEGVSRASSYISTKLDDKASSAHNLARLEMALSRLEFALERTARMPITHVSLLRRVKMLRSAYAEGTALLNEHRPRVVEGQAGAGQAATTTRYPFLQWIGRARNLSISSLLGFNNKDHLSSTAVQAFEWYADCAEKFVTDAETGCPLGRDTFRYPFVRLLLEGKTIWYESVRGSRRMRFHMLPLRLGDRGVEAELYYCHLDLKKPQNNFCVWLMLRLTESTDIVGVAIKCLQLLTSQFSLAIESAVGELTLLPGLQDVSHSYAPPLDCVQDTYASRDTEYWRPDPTCCNGNDPRALGDNIVSQVSSPSGVPEPVIAIGFSCWISAPEYRLRNAGAPPLYVEAFFTPHLCCAPRPAIVRKYGGKEECAGGSMQQMEEVIRSDALDYLVHEPEPTEYAMFWLSAHGAAFVTLRKSSNEKAWPKPAAAPGRGRSAGKRKR